MERIKNDEECLEIIKKLINYDFYNENESSNLLCMLEDYVTGLADIITQEKILSHPSKILEIAREKNKVILL